MPPLLRRKRRGPRGPVVGDRFAVVPVIPDDVEVRRDSRGMVHLRRNAAPEGLVRKVAAVLGYDYTRKLELDEYGTFYFEQVDGATPLHEIVDRMMEKLQQDREPTAEAVVLFTKKLMTMNLIALKVPQSAQVRRPDEQS
jgi:hypothetical protein